MKLSLLIGVGIFALTPLAEAQSQAGRTILTKGQVGAQNTQTQASRTLKRRAPVYLVDNVTTGQDSRTQLSMVDGGMITMKSNSNLLISQYDFNPQTQEGSVALELIKGGFRSISGSLKAASGNYTVKTPVASIGIRGTHYEIQLVDDELFIAVWDGQVELILPNNKTQSLGADSAFSFARVSSMGEVKTLTQVPAVFEQGYSSDDQQITAAVTSVETTAIESATTVSPVAVEPVVASTNEAEVELDTEVYTEEIWQATDTQSIAEQIAERSGSLTYATLDSFTLNSTAGDASNFALSMTIDFDTASIPVGSLSLDDAGGSWFAAFSGLINVDQMELGITFASHGDAAAEGSIQSAFTDGLDSITGSFILNEVADTSVQSDGSFVIKP